MKRLKIIILSIIFIVFYSTLVFAEVPELIMTGENIATPLETKSIRVKITSNEEIGVVSGKIENNENIKSITLVEKNDWNLTYNNTTGVFYIYKAKGAKSEEIMDIKYETANSEGIGIIKISDIQFTTIEYKLISINNIEKSIKIEKASSINNEKDTKNMSANVGTYLNRATTNPYNIGSYIMNRTLPQTGFTNVLVVLIIGLIIIVIFFYAKYKSKK